MKSPDKTLSEQYSDHVNGRTATPGVNWSALDQKRRRHISTLARRNISTVSELIEQLPDLPDKLKDFALWWFSITRERRAEKAVLAMMKGGNHDRITCAATLSAIHGSRSRREFIRIGRHELAQAIPDRHWLDAVVQGLKLGSDDSNDVDEILVTIYERADLPGWLRGDAADALGGRNRVGDRRTSVFRRAWTTALQGLFDVDIEVQFWSMYIVMSVAHTFDPRRSNALFSKALPQLRKIAKTDHRLAPGYWWPMSAEAEDAIYAIENGSPPERDASDKWLGNTERGPMIRD
ncbi:MAG TPA: hypothetical protein VGM98_10445 [Schlesneria sp.]|jgi:hypothetical protein